MTSNIKNPPGLEKSSSYEQWEMSLKMWQLVTDLKLEQQGPAVFLSLSGKAKDAVYDLGVENIKSAQGVDKILEVLGKIYKKDEVDTAYEAFESFINFRREENMNISQFINEFERRYNKAKPHGCELSKGILGYFLLNQANLSPENKKLVRATITKLDLEEVKTKLSKVFGSSEGTLQNLNDLNIKVEDMNLAEGCDEEEDIFYGQARYGRGRGGYSRGNYSSYQTGNYRGRNRNTYEQKPSNRGKTNSWNQQKKTAKPRCHICESVLHYASECPHRTYYCEEEESHDIILYQSNLVTDTEYSIFVSESSNAAILDSGASATVAGKSWFESYFDGLSEAQQKSVEFLDSNRVFKFGSEERFSSLYRALIPAKIGKNEVSISTDVIDNKIPLLLSKDAMKRADTEINFLTDSVKMFGQEQSVYLTKSGHYALPLNSSRQIMNNIDQKPTTKIVLVCQNGENDKKKIAMKLHSQFGHPVKKKLVKLLERAGRHYDEDLMKEIDKVYDNCKICKEFRRPDSKPVVGFPHASDFNETVALDLKVHNGIIILHLIDHLTRFSSAIRCNSKEPKEIIGGVIKAWIALFGPPKKFLMDNGGEFVNEKFIELAEAFNIRIMTTAAESPWSNGLVERHNGTLAATLDKVLAEEPKLPFDVALAWAVNAKNSLTNVHGFSPSQLTFGFNPQLPSVVCNKPPALESRTSQDIITDNLNAMKMSREAFMKAESSERIKRALKHNISAGNNKKFFLGDLVYYKRNDSHKWKGPGKVIGTESSNVLIKHGAYYVRVHACRVKLEKKGEYNESNTENEREEQRESAPDDNSENNDTDDDKDETVNEANSRLSTEEMNLNNMEDQDKQDQTLIQPANTISAKVSTKLRPGMTVEYELENGEKSTGYILQRTGKATGKYRHFWNVKNENNETVEFDTENDWIKWKEIEKLQEEEDDIFITDSEIQNEKQAKIKAAKELEMEKWIEEKVIEEVSDEGQERLSTTWVMTEKLVDGMEVIKARLVVRGYEEVEKVRADSPTCHKDSVRLLLAISISKDWILEALDIKAAFLQGGNIERELYVTSPKEFRKEGILWKLRKVVYGLCDASRSWYLRLNETLIELGMKACSMDRAVYRFGRNSIQGIIMVHVDDILYSGDKIFLEKVIFPFKKIFKISREDSVAFKYLGINITRHKDCLTIDQKEYLKAMKPDLLTEEYLKDKTRQANHEERHIFKQAVGQLGWITNMCRPDAAYMFCALSTIQSKPLIGDFIRFRKAVRDLKMSDTWIKIGKIDLENCCLTAFSDASFASLGEGASQLGYIIFLHDTDGNCVPLSWASRKAKRVARSSLTAETLAAVEAIDSAVAIKSFVEEILYVKVPSLTLFTDNKSLYDAARTTNSLADKRLLIDMSAIREMIDKEELNLKWVNSENQLADVLTKLGANKQRLTSVLASGMLPLR